MHWLRGLHMALQVLARAVASFQAPWGALAPAAHRLGSPGICLIRVTQSAGVWDFVSLCHRWADEAEGMGADEGCGNSFGLDLRHVAGDALATGAATLVVRMLFKGRGARAVRGERAMTIETEFVGRLSQLCVVVRAVNVMAGKTGYAASVHNALHEVVALHAIFVGGAIGQMGERRFAESVLFELPVIL